MANDGRIYDGTTVTVAMDAETHPSNLPPSYVASCVNRSFRQGINSTRPPFADLQINLAYGYPESVLTDFQTGNFQGAYPYKGISPGSVDGIICSVAGTIYFLAIVNNVCTLYPLISGNDPTLMHTWFVQAENWVYIQNGYQDPIAWSGDISHAPTNLQAVGDNNGHINLTWTVNAVGSFQTEIQVQTPTTIFNTIAIIPSGAVSYSYQAASSTTAYSFQVRSVYPDGSATPWSNVVTTSSSNTQITPEQNNTVYRLNPAAQQMPVGTIMAYAYGRVAVSTAQNNI